MTGEGVSGGDAGGGGVTGDEAAWRDLVARYDMPADVDDAAAPWPDRENLTAPPPVQGPGGQDPGSQDPGSQDPESAPGAAGRHGPGPASHGRGAGADPTRVIRPATPPPRRPGPGPGPAAAAQDDDEHYIPPPPPPLPRLDPVAKGAWTALFGGPAYLLLTSVIGWPVPGWAAFLAVMAFVGGFAVVVLRLGDGPSRRDGPDNGAVL